MTFDTLKERFGGIAITTMKWLVSLLLLIVSLSLLDWNALGRSLHSLTPMTAAAAFLLSLIEYPLLAVRWHYLSKNAVALSLGEQVRVYCTSQIFNMFTPAQLGGDAYRYFMVRRAASRHSEVLVLLVQERLVGLVAYLGLFLIGAAWFEAAGGARGLSESATIILRLLELVFLVAIVLLFAARPLLSLGQEVVRRMGIELPRRIVEALEKALSLANLPSGLPVFVLSFIGVAAWGLTVWLLARNLGCTLGLAEILVISTLVELVRLVPITIQGIGLRESAFAVAFSVVGQSPETGFVVGALAYLAVTASGLLAGAAGLAWTQAIGAMKPAQSEGEVAPRG